MPTKKSEKIDIAKEFRGARDSLDQLIQTLPITPRTSGQRSLMNTSGTPFEFAKACLKSFSQLEITFEEAKAAIVQYRDEWEKAV